MSTEKENLRIITDPVMEPYFISMDDYCMTVNVKITPDARYTNSGKDYNKTIGHYNNLANALKAIARDKVNSKSYESLNEYIDTYNSTINLITEKISI